MIRKTIADILPAATVESVAYQNGVLAGYHACGVDHMAAAIDPQHYQVLGVCGLWRAVAARRRGIDAWRPREWFLGFVAGYLVCKEHERLWVEEHQSKEGRSEERM